MVHLWLPDFAVAVERQRVPSLEGRPVVVGGRPGGRGVVAAASREARDAGVVAGMPLSQVPACCPDAQFVAGDIERYLEAADAVDELIRHDVDVVEWPALDEAVFEVPRSASRRSAVGAVEAVQQRVKARLGFDVACGVARRRVVARAAARLVAPRGLLCVLDGYEECFLAPLALEWLEGITPQAAAALRAAGVRSMGELAARPPDEARRWLGRSAAVLTSLARGDDPRGVVGRPTPRTLWREIVCADPAAGEGLGLVHAVEDLASSLGLSLRERGWTARAVSVRVQQAPDGTPLERTAALREATNLDASLADALRADARRLAMRTLGPVTVTLVARGLLELPSRQLRLFDTTAASHPRPARARTARTA